MAITLTNISFDKTHDELIRAWGKPNRYFRHYDLKMKEEEKGRIQEILIMFYKQKLYDVLLFYAKNHDTLMLKDYYVGNKIISEQILNLYFGKKKIEIWFDFNYKEFYAYKGKETKIYIMRQNPETEQWSMLPDYERIFN